MSTDQKVTKDLVQTLEDGHNGFTKGAEKVAELNDPAVVEMFLRYATQRQQFAQELESMAASYGDHVEESGSLAAAVHRGWMTLKDALSGSNPKGVLDVAAQGEDHAVSEYDKALGEDISAGLRTVVERQLVEIRSARDAVAAVQAAHD